MLLEISRNFSFHVSVNYTPFVFHLEIKGRVSGCMCFLLSGAIRCLCYTCISKKKWNMRLIATGNSYMPAFLLGDHHL